MLKEKLIQVKKTKFLKFFEFNLLILQCICKCLFAVQQARKATLYIGNFETESISNLISASIANSKSLQTKMINGKKLMNSAVGNLINARPLIVQILPTFFMCKQEMNAKKQQ